MFPYPPQNSPSGNAPQGYPPNIQNQSFFQQSGFSQNDFPPLQPPYLPQQIPIPIQPTNSQIVLTPGIQNNISPLAQHNIPNASSIRNSDVEFYSDSSDTEKENDGQKEEENKHKWQNVQKKRKRKPNETRTQNNSETSTHNRFSPLYNAADNEENSRTSTHRDKPNTPRPPPIFVYGVKNFMAMLDNLAKAAEPETYRTLAMANETVKITAHSIETYRKLVRHMKEENIVHHTYQLKEERAYRIVIRHLHYSVPPDDIKEELLKKGHKVRNIMNIKHKITKEPLSLFFVDLEPQDNNKEIFNLQFLGNTKIIIEAPHKTRTIVQCLRCQAYGHSKAYCTKPYQCVKCGGQHDTRNCKKPRNNPAKCALCGNDHPANYKGCEVYKNLIAIRNNQARANNYNQQQSSNHPNQQRSYHIHPTNRNQQLNSLNTNAPAQNGQRTYSQVTNNNQNTTAEYSTIAEHLTTFLNEFKTMFSQLMNQNGMILNLLTTVINKLNI